MFKLSLLLVAIMAVTGCAQALTKVTTGPEIAPAPIAGFWNQAGAGEQEVAPLGTPMTDEAKDNLLLNSHVSEVVSEPKLVPSDLSIPATIRVNPGRCVACQSNNTTKGADRS